MYLKQYWIKNFMEALISNYTEKENHRPQIAKSGFRLGFITKRTNAIVVYESRAIGLNYRIFNLLRSFKKLENNWDLDDAIAPNNIAINRAKALVTLFQSIGQKIYHTAPGPNGEIMLDLRSVNNNKSIEFIIYQDKINVVFIPEKELPQQCNFDIKSIENYLNWLNK